MVNNISLKSPGPWYTIEAVDHDDAVAKLLSLLGAQAPTEPVSLPTLIGYAQLWYEAQLNVGLSGIAAGTAPQNVQAAAPLAPSPSVQQSSSAAPQPQPAAPAQPAAWQPPEVPQYQPPATVAPTAPTEGSGAGLPNGVSVWTAPSSKKPEYTSVYFSYPFISDAAGRKALQEDFKNQGWAKPYDTNAKPWVYEASKSSFSEADARALITKYAVLFG